MNPAVPSPAARQPGEPRGIRSIPTRLTNVVLRNLLRVVRFRASLRGGKRFDAFGGDEGVAAQGDRDVVMPAGIATPFVVVESKLTFEIFIDAFRPPALLYRSDQAFLGRGFGQRQQVEFAGRRFTVEPLHEQPNRLAL